MYRSVAVLLVTLTKLLWAIPVPNGVEGEPEIECGPTAITVSFNTQAEFEGRVYVKGLFNQQGCRNDKTGGRVASLSLPFDTCNVQRTRSLNPRGIFVRTTVIISFHPHFETKVDRAYTLQCFYMEADKTVSTELEVSMLTTGFRTQVVPMPVCRYEILDGGPNGQPIRYAIIGQQVYHKWTCDTETTDIFCMIVHSCFVDDGAGDKVDLLDTNGCAQDRYLLRNLEYLTDLMAGQEAHVFKYADRMQLFFQCQISISIKEPNQQCPRPSCPEPPGRGGGGAGAALNALLRHRFRSRRAVEEEVGTIDVLAQLESLEMDDQLTTLPEALSHRPPPPQLRMIAKSDFCLSTPAFGSLIAAVICAFCMAVIAVVTLCFNKKRKE